ncbi:MAG: hypothetical protein J0I17_08995 ['Candidatus Kapabacteria' thiocyanatum]|uniref:Uncharacterized protein n=1 Tax=Candidatus Kapaibacterium thiocyanatum TaxID=1895771 RepID=A0A1M3KZ16_9BACT|nr:hypothetical protein ['Candidatus Kapabacteria' thiocyanatum]OJX57752.1 MAG: hypothetical protein BGO89_07220 ['Candidatus Kapabacteria' thiocyanatum]
MKQLTLFEILAAIIPGALVIVGMVYQYDYLVVIEKPGSMTIGDLTVLTMAALTLGMVLQGPARFLKDWLADKILPVRFTLYTPSPELLSSAQQERVKKILESRYGIPRNADGRDREQQVVIKMGYKEAVVALRTDGHSERFERLTVYQSMYRGLSCACSVLILLGIFAPMAQPSKIWMLAGLLVAILSILMRMLQSERTRMTELFLQLLVLESAGKKST